MKDELAAIRAQRAEVEALLAFRHAPEEARPVAWWQLQQVRRARIGLMDEALAARLPDLPPPPPGALSRVQVLRLRFGWLDLQRCAPPARLRRSLQPVRILPAE